MSAVHAASAESFPGNARAFRHLAAFGFVVVFAVGHFALSGGPWTHWWADIAWTLAAFAAGLECLQAARRLAGRRRKAWVFFAAGCLAWFAGMLVWDYQELVRQAVTPFPYFSDVGFLALAPLFVIGLIYKFTARPGATVTLKNLADLGVIASVVTMGSLLALGETLADPVLAGLYKLAATAFPVLYLSAFVFALLALLRHGNMTGRGVLALILISLGLHAVTDSLYAYSLLDQTYQAGHYLDIYWIAAFALTYSAAVEQRYVSTDDEVGATDVGPLTTRTRYADTLVFAGVVFALGLVAYWQRGDAAGAFQDMPYFLLVLAVFLGLREWANHRAQLELLNEVRASEGELGRILENLDDAYYRTNNDGYFVKVSGAIKKLLGYEPSELIGTLAADLHSDLERRKGFLEAIEANGGHVHDYELHFIHKDGGVVWTSTSAHRVYDDAGNVVGLEGTSRDVSAQRSAQAEMRKLSSAVQQAADAIMITDRNGIIEYVNAAFETITGYGAGQAVGLTPRLLKSGNQSPGLYKKLWETITSGNAFHDVLINRRKDGTFYYEAKTITPLMSDDGTVTHFVSTGKDITEQMEAQERLHFIAHHDMLTGLPNRTLFLDRVDQALGRTRWHGRLAAVLFMDVDQFKYVNDSLGHEVGDQLLVKVAERLESTLRPGDTISRFGGDEFVILLDDVASYEHITQVVERLRAELKAPMEVDGLALRATVTVGISVCPHDGEDARMLLKNADNAMYRAKEAGRDTYAYYSDEMSQRVVKRLALETRLRDAVEKDEFELYYQPQIDIERQRIVGVETLLRWHHPETGLVMPSEFVPILEETGLIERVGEWVLETACKQVREWNQHGDEPIELAVNISARQFSDAGFLQCVKSALQTSGLAAWCLQLEMTETIYLRTSHATSELLDELGHEGVKLAIDDFGTGYSALNYLKRFPIHTLKIDRSFIRDIPEDNDDAMVTGAILAMSEGMGLRTVAEGVETQAQLEFLRKHGCRYVQGFLFSKPCPADALGALLEEPRELIAPVMGAG